MLKTLYHSHFLLFCAATELFAIGQGLPGPTSTQLVISTALARAGPLGGLLAFFLWNLPGLIILTTSGVLISEFIDPDDPPFWLVGLPPAAIALVFKAMYGFGAKLDKLGVILALISTCIAILINGDEHIAPTSSQYVFPSMLAAGGLVTFIDSKRKKPLGKVKSGERIIILCFLFFQCDVLSQCVFIQCYDVHQGHTKRLVRDGTPSQTLR